MTSSFVLLYLQSYHDNRSNEVEAAEYFLVPLGKADTVIDFTHTSIMTAGIKDCLRKLG